MLVGHSAWIEKKTRMSHMYLDNDNSTFFKWSNYQRPTEYTGWRMETESIWNEQYHKGNLKDKPEPILFV